MKKILMSLFLMSAVSSFGQHVDSTSIYYKALFHYLDYLDRHQFERKEIYIEENNGITEKLPTKIDSTIVTIIKFENKEEIYRRNNNNIRHIRIFPARTKNELIEINFTPYFGEYKGKKNGYWLNLSNWVIIQFKYDCTENKFKYWDTKGGGI